VRLNREEDDTEVPDEADQYASLEEAAEALAGLAESDIKKLMIVAKYWFRLFPLRAGYGGPDDLLQNAVLQTLRGKRRWRISVVSIVKHLDRSIESIARNTPAKIKKDTRAERAAHALDEPHAKPTDTTSRSHFPPSSTPESQLVARDELRAIEELFVDDEEALDVVRFRALGMEASQIQRELGIDNRKWETLRKRVQRKLIKYTKEGGRP
jgi:DNA-directed RNA polymerase specialized sigma24 family protein